MIIDRQQILDQGKADYDELYKAGKLKTLRDSKYMHPTVSGEIIRIDDMSKVPHKVTIGKRSDTVEDLDDVKVYKYGKNLTTARQVYAKANKYLETEVDGRQCIRMTSGIEFRLEFSFIKPNTQYTVSFFTKNEEFANPTTSNSVFTFFYDDGTFTDVRGVWGSTEWYKRQSTSTLGKTVIAIGIRAVEYRIYNFIDINTFQFEEGAIATEYEPYHKEEIGETFDSTTDIVTLIPDTSGVILDCQYCRDIDKYIDNLNVAIAMTGGAT